MSALRRVSVMAEERNKPVKLTLAPASLKLSASSSELGEAEEALTVDYAGEEVAIAFNSRYVLEALSPMEDEAVVFEFKDGLSPGVIKSADGRRLSLCYNADAYLTSVLARKNNGFRSEEQERSLGADWMDSVTRIS